MTRRMLAPALAALLALAACSSNTPSGNTAAPAATSTAAATTAAASPTPTYCPNGRLPTGACAGGTSAVPQLMNDPVAPLVCPKILKVQSTQAIYDDPKTMQAIGDQAADSLNVDVSQAGKMLADRAKLAAAAKGDAAASIQMGTAATQLATVCTKAGFKA